MKTLLALLLFCGCAAQDTNLRYFTKLGKLLKNTTADTKVLYTDDGEQYWLTIIDRSGRGLPYDGFVVRGVDDGKIIYVAFSTESKHMKIYYPELNSMKDCRIGYDEFIDGLFVDGSYKLIDHREIDREGMIRERGILSYPPEAYGLRKRVERNGKGFD